MERSSASASLPEGSDEPQPYLLLGPIGCMLYSLLACVSVASFVVHVFFQKHGASSSSPDVLSVQRRRVSRLFHASMLLFAVVRAFSFFTLFVNDPYVTVVKRFGNVLHFSSLFVEPRFPSPCLFHPITSDTRVCVLDRSVVIYWWGCIYGKSMRFRGRSLLPSLFWTLVVLNVLAFVLSLVFVVIWWATTQGEWTQSGWYQASIWTTVAINTFMRIAVPSFALFVYLRQRDDTWFMRSEARELRRVLVCALVFFVTGMLTVAFYLYGPVTMHEPDLLLYYPMAYFVPEIVASAFMIYTIHSSGRSGENDGQLITKLFQDAKRTPVPSPSGSLNAPLLGYNTQALPVRALASRDTLVSASAPALSLHNSTTQYKY